MNIVIPQKYQDGGAKAAYKMGHAHGYRKQQKIDADKSFGEHAPAYHAGYRAGESSEEGEAWREKRGAALKGRHYHEGKFPPALAELEQALENAEEGRHADFHRQGDMLVTRYWGEWEGDDGSGDYDWQTLTKKSSDVLSAIVKRVESNNKVKFHTGGGEKNYITFRVKTMKEETVEITEAKKVKKRVKKHVEKLKDEGSSKAAAIAAAATALRLNGKPAHYAEEVATEAAEEVYEGRSHNGRMYVVTDTNDDHSPEYFVGTYDECHDWCDAHEDKPEYKDCEFDVALNESAITESEEMTKIAKDEDDEPRRAHQLEIGDVVEITGNVNFKGQTGEITRFGKEKKFVVVKLYNGGEHSFHSSDVSEADLSHEEHDEDEGEKNKFYVAFYDNAEERSWIGVVTKEAGGKWHEKTFKGKPEIRWGQTYMSYLTPDDIMSWIHKDYHRGIEIEGPFFSASEAQEHVKQNWGRIDEARVLGRGMSKAARAADVEQSDREYIAQRQKRKAEKEAARIAKNRFDAEEEAKDNALRDKKKAEKARGKINEGFKKVQPNSASSAKTGWYVVAKNDGEVVEGPFDTEAEARETGYDPKQHSFKKMPAKKVDESLTEGTFTKRTAMMPADDAIAKAKKIRALLSSGDGHAQVERDGDRAFLLIKANSELKDKITKILEGFKKVNPKSQERVSYDREGQRVKTPDGEGVVKAEYKEPTFSQMVPFVRTVSVQLDGSDKTKSYRLNAVRFIKESVFTNYSDWKQSVMLSHPTKNIKFRGKMEGEKTTVIASVPGEDTVYGIWDDVIEAGKIIAEGEAESDHEMHYDLEDWKNTGKKLGAVKFVPDGKYIINALDDKGKTIGVWNHSIGGAYKRFIAKESNIVEAAPSKSLQEIVSILAKATRRPYGAAYAYFVGGDHEGMKGMADQLEKEGFDTAGAWIENRKWYLKHGINKADFMKLVKAGQ